MEFMGYNIYITEGENPRFRKITFEKTFASNIITSRVEIYEEVNPSVVTSVKWFYLTHHEKAVVIREFDSINTYEDGKHQDSMDDSLQMRYEALGPVVHFCKKAKKYGFHVL
jgi:hypothetical protein